MRGSILVTDDLFIFDSHVREIEAAGYTVERLANSCAEEPELIEAVRGKVGYILGGIETVTDAVIDAADQLRVIAFTGTGYTEAIPAHLRATRKGIAITAARGGNARSVAEFTLGFILAAARETPLLTDPQGKKGKTTHEFSALTVGVVGLGAIGAEVARLCEAVGFKVLTFSRSASSVGANGRATSLDHLLAESDIVSLHVNKEHGHHALTAEGMASMKTGAALINCAFPDAVDNAALFQAVQSGALRAFFDAPPKEVPTTLPIGSFVTSNAQAAYNTAEANQRVSDMAVNSLLAVLRGEKDPYVVNPAFAMT